MLATPVAPFLKKLNMMSPDASAGNCLDATTFLVDTRTMRLTTGP